MDNTSFINVSPAGEPDPIKKLKNGKFHVVGDLAITPGILYKPMYPALGQLVELCGDRRIYILTHLPRYILVPCCDHTSHCVNLLVKDNETHQGVFYIMNKLDQSGKTISSKFPSCMVINTGNLLAGQSGVIRHEILDVMITCLMTDPVHSIKSDYTKLAMKLVEKMEDDISYCYQYYVLSNFIFSVICCILFPS